MCNNACATPSPRELRLSPNLILLATPSLGPWYSPFELDRGPIPCLQDKRRCAKSGGGMRKKKRVRGREREEGREGDGGRRVCTRGSRDMEASETSGHLVVRAVTQNRRQ